MGRLPPIDNEYTLSQVELGGGLTPALPRELRLPSARAVAATVVFAAAASAVTWADGLDWTPDRVLLVFLAPALVLRRGRNYLVDFVPFALLIMLYAECRGLAHLAAPHPFYRPQLWLERHLFGGVPAAWLQERFWHGSMQWYDAAAAKVLNLHFVVPPLVAFALWAQRRQLFFPQPPFEFQIQLDPLPLQGMREQMFRVQPRTFDPALREVIGRRLQDLEKRHGNVRLRLTIP